MQATNAAFIRLILAVFLFLASLLTVFPPVSYFLWQASIAVQELGYLGAIAGLLLLIPGWKTKLGKLSSGLALVATILLLSPVVRATIFGGELSGRLQKAFGASVARAMPGAPARDKPISFATLFRKPPAPYVGVTTMTYVTRDLKPMMLDVYRRDVIRRDGTLQPAPLVVAIHGGSWRSGHRSDLPALNFYLASRGYVVATPSYRFAPEFHAPATSSDIYEAIGFLKTNSLRLGIDSTQIVLLGRSAGGQLALDAAYKIYDPSIKGVVSLYAPSDQKWGWDNPADPRVYDSRKTLRDFLGGDPASAPHEYTWWSPIEFARPGVPATLIIHGAMDPLVSVRQSERLDSVFTAFDNGTNRPLQAGEELPGGRAPHLLLELPWATHGCDYVFNGPCGQITTYAIERFLAAVMPVKMRVNLVNSQAAH